MLKYLPLLSIWINRHLASLTLDFFLFMEKREAIDKEYTPLVHTCLSTVQTLSWSKEGLVQYSNKQYVSFREGGFNDRSSRIVLQKRQYQTE